MSKSLTEIQRAVKIARRNRQDVEYAYMHLLLDVAEAAKAEVDNHPEHGEVCECHARLAAALEALSPDQEKEASGA